MIKKVALIAVLVSGTSYAMQAQSEQGTTTAAPAAQATGSAVPAPPPPPPVLGDDPVFPTVEVMPILSGCEQMSDPKERDDCSKQKMKLFIADHVEYPKEAKSAQVEGDAMVEFVVDEKGGITDIKLLTDLGHGCGEEAIRVIEQMKEANMIAAPGQSGGRSIKVQYKLPVRFKSPSK